MTENDFKKMSELDIIRLIKNPSTDEFTFNKASEFLLKKYDRMFHKHWWTLQKQMNNSSLINSLKDEYYSLAYEAFFTVIQKIDLDRVYDEKFKLMQLLSWYLTNVRTRLIKETRRKGKMKAVNAMSMCGDEEDLTVDSDVESSYWESEGYKTSPDYRLIEVEEKTREYNETLDKCYKKWNEREKCIFDLLKEGKGKVEIAKELGVSPYKVYSSFKKIKNDLKEAFHIVTY